MTTKITDQWLAGFIDGEGCLSLVEGKRKEGYPDWKPSLHIANTDRAALELIQDHLGCGGIYVVHKGQPGRWRMRYQFVITGTRQLLPVLRRLAPHLIVKAGQAEALISFMEGVTSTVGSRGLSNEETERRRAIRARIRGLNGGRQNVPVEFRAAD